MAIIENATRFGGEALFTNGTWTGLTSSNAFGMGSVFTKAFETVPAERTVENLDGSTSHFTGNGAFTGTTTEDILGNRKFLNTDGDITYMNHTPSGITIADSEGFHHILGDSDNAMDLANLYASEVLEHSDAFADLITSPMEG